MTFWATTTRIKTKNFREYEEKRIDLISKGYRITRNYKEASHFNKAGVEVVVIKDFC